MDKVNDGGPAFPQQLSDGQCERGGTKHFGRAGMTLRDWFATYASESDIETFLPPTVGDAIKLEKADGIKRTRQWARFQHADAMLAERAKQKS